MTTLRRVTGSIALAAAATGCGGAGSSQPGRAPSPSVQAAALAGSFSQIDSELSIHNCGEAQRHSLPGVDQQIARLPASVPDAVRQSLADSAVRLRAFVDGQCRLSPTKQQSPAAHSDSTSWPTSARSSSTRRAAVSTPRPANRAPNGSPHALSPTRPAPGKASPPTTQPSPQPAQSLPTHDPSSRDQQGIVFFVRGVGFVWVSDAGEMSSSWQSQVGADQPQAPNHHADGRGRDPFGQAQAASSATGQPGAADTRAHGRRAASAAEEGG